MLNNLFDLKERKALVTGASKGIGRILALALAEAGCDISIMDIDINNSEIVADEIRKIGRTCIIFEVDVAQKDDVRSAFVKTVKELKALDICVNNAGVCIHQGSEEIPEEDWDYILNINLKGLFFCCQEAARIMIPQKRGKIINIASMSGTIANVPQKQAHYNASKAGVIMLTKSLAVEWAAHGIRVNSVSPGYMKTEITLMAQNLFPEWESLIPMGRLGDPEELRGIVIFLASDASSYVTGSNFIVDGGYTAR